MRSRGSDTTSEGSVGHGAGEVMSGAGGDLEGRIGEALSEQAGVPVEVTRVKPLHGGACQDNVRVDCRFAEGPLAGERRLVLRGDTPSALPGSISRREEFEVIRAAVDAGVRSPVVRWPLKDLLRRGAWSYFLDWVPGVAIGRKVVSDPRLEEARAGLPEVLADNLARIHGITPATAPDLPLPDMERTVEGGPAAHAVRFVRDMIARLPEPHPALVLAVRWLEANVPSDREVTLVHGDFRTGNFMVTPGGLAGILDWEFAHWGSPFDDLAWISVRDWRFGALDRPVGGFGSRRGFYEAYERATDRAVVPETVHWWEVLGNVRWGAACAYQGERYLSGEVPDFELIAIARRACEMEWEALRLIEVGPAWAGPGEDA
ncbi:MAG: phosphotransferase family protein [Myxococcota bacterium]